MTSPAEAAPRPPEAAVGGTVGGPVGATGAPARTGSDEGPTRTPPFLIGLVGGFGVLAAYYVGQGLLNVLDIIVMITMGLVLAAGLNPFVEELCAHGFRRRWAVAVVALTALFLFAGFIAVIAKPLADQTSLLLHHELPNGLRKLQDNATVKRLDARYHLIQKAQDWISNPDTAKSLAGGALGFGKALIGSVFKAFTILMLTVYFLGSLPSLRTGALRLVPRSRRERADDLTERVLSRVGGYVSGAIVVASCATLASWVAMHVMQVTYALPLALLVGLTDLIPMIGATFGALAAATVIFLESPFKAFAALIFFIAYQQLENYLIYPRVMSRSVDLPPAVAVIAALAGYALLGVIGALLFIPLAAGLLVVVRQIVLPAQDRAA